MSGRCRAIWANTVRDMNSRGTGYDVGCRDTKTQDEEEERLKVMLQNGNSDHNVKKICLEPIITQCDIGEDGRVASLTEYDLDACR